MTGAAQDRLETAILSGPPREMYRDDLEPERWKDRVARSVWLRLAKLNSSGLALSSTAQTRLAELSRAYPKWQLAVDECDEFSIWICGPEDQDYEESREIDIAPRKRRELVQWLAKPQSEQRPPCEDTWREVCRNRFFHSLFALCDLARDGVWSAGRWREALQVWSEEGMEQRSWCYAAPLVQTMPDTVIHEIAYDVAWWIKVASESINRHEDIRCPPWRAKRRRVVPGSREATRDTRRAEGAKGDPKGASERGVQSYGRPVCSRNELAMLWRNAG